MLPQLTFTYRNLPVIFPAFKSIFRALPLPIRPSVLNGSIRDSTSDCCPVQGLYLLRDAKIDMETMSAFIPPELVVNNVWLIDVSVFDEQMRLHVCFSYESDVLRWRVKAS